MVWSSLLYLFGLCKRHQDHLPNQKHKIHWASQPVRNYVNIGKTGRTFRTVEVYEKKCWCSIRHAISPEVCLKAEKKLIWCSKFILGNASLNFRGVTRSLWLTGWESPYSNLPRLFLGFFQYVHRHTITLLSASIMVQDDPPSYDKEAPAGAEWIYQC